MTFEEVTYDENLLQEQQEKINAVFTKIGERFYYANKKGGGSEYADLFDEVKACEKAIADHKAAVLLEHGMILCPRCGEQIYYKSVFCNFCGVRVDSPDPQPEPEPDPEPEPEPEPDPVVEEPVVEEHVSVPPTKQFPPLDPVASDEPAEEVIPETTYAPEEAPASNGVCAKCGAPLEPDCRFCVECGAPVEVVPTAASNSVRYCPDCHYMVTDDEAMFCNNCGARLGGPASMPQRPTGKTCPFCGFSTTDPDVMFCIECGTRLEK